jgi:hypothetical protein
MDNLIRCVNCRHYSTVAWERKKKQAGQCVHSVTVLATSLRSCLCSFSPSMLIFLAILFKPQINGNTRVEVCFSPFDKTLNGNRFSAVLRKRRKLIVNVGGVDIAIHAFLKKSANWGCMFNFILHPCIGAFSYLRGRILKTLCPPVCRRITSWELLNRSTWNLLLVPFQLWLKSVKQNWHVTWKPVRYAFLRTFPACVRPFLHTHTHTHTHTQESFDRCLFDYRPHYWLFLTRFFSFHGRGHWCRSWPDLNPNIIIVGHP